MSAPTGRLKFAYDSIANLEQQIATLRAQLAASESRAGRYRAALLKLACLGNGDCYGNSHGNVIAQEALAEGEVKP